MRKRRPLLLSKALRWKCRPFSLRLLFRRFDFNPGFEFLAKDKCKFASRSLRFHGALRWSEWSTLGADETQFLTPTNEIARPFFYFLRGHEREMENRFGVAAEAWNSVGHDGVLEAYTQSHPRVPEQRETPVR